MLPSALVGWVTGRYVMIIHGDMVRIAGEAKLVIMHDGGVVEKAFFIPNASVRGFERLVRGKNPLFVVEAVMRICGLC